MGSTKFFDENVYLAWRQIRTVKWVMYSRCDQCFKPSGGKCERIYAERNCVARKPCAHSSFSSAYLNDKFIHLDKILMSASRSSL